MLELAAAAIAILLGILAARPGALCLWLLPIAAGPAAGAAGWAAAPATHGPALQLAATVALLLPVIVMGMAWRGIPQDFAETVVACGASPLQTLVHARIRPALPILAASLALAFLLALGITPMLAPLAARP
jgi:ABC-type proline/glycine betaine transport system permease subunit